MTCIVGITDGKTVTIGGDSAGTNSYMDLTLRADLKVWSDDEWAFGFCGSFRMGQILRHAFSPPAMMRDQDLDHFMCVSFIDAVRQALKDGGYAKSNKGEEEGGNFLVGHSGRLFNIQSDYQVGETTDAFDAIGCGEPFARGALMALPTSMQARARAKKALEIAAACSGGVRGPFHIVSVTA